MSKQRPITPEEVLHTNKLFRLYLLDLIETKGITAYRVAKDCGLTRQFVYNKLNLHSDRYVTLLTITLIANTHNFNFDLFKYENMLKEQEKDKK